MTEHLLERSQLIAADLPAVWAFFENPHNLERITPSWLHFTVRHASEAPVREGTRIAYRIRWQGIPMAWESRISEYREDEMFADEMIRGPYARWYHRHDFRATRDGVEVNDTVHYLLPLGGLGRLVERALVRRQLDAIFDFRARAAATILSGG